ncbi:MAG: CapA family protein [Alphaproteobacteria bacterium]|nr:CapA family protein [Alphaproteobacteria bacterium]
MTTNWTLCAVGDVFLNRSDTVDAFEFVRPIFNACNVVFGNCEGAYATHHRTTPTASGFSLVSTPDQARPLKSAGFNVMSLANNHALDASHEGLMETIGTLRDMDIRVVGAGADLAAARRPDHVTAAGQKVGFLAFTAVFPAGYEARATAPGVAAMRAHTHYFVHPEAFGRVEPGADPCIRTFPFPEDMAALQQILETARAAVDVLVVSFHWGKSVRPAALMDYEVSYGRAAVEFGADLVLGHHHHLLRAVEIYQQKPIFFGLSHFAFDMPGLEEALGPDRIERLKTSGEFAIFPREGYPLLQFHPDARMTAIAVVQFEGRSIARQFLIPCLINPKNQPVPVDVASEMGRRIQDYLDQITREVGTGTAYAPSETRIAGHSALDVRPESASGD